MYRVLAVVVIALAGAAIWRRRELRSDAERASKAIAGAAGSARSRIQGDEGDGDAGESEPEATVEGGGDELLDPSGSTASST